MDSASATHTPYVPILLYHFGGFRIIILSYYLDKAINDRIIAMMEHTGPTHLVYFASFTSHCGGGFEYHGSLFAISITPLGGNVMPTRQGFMVEKMSEAQIQEIINQYTACGWKFHSLQEHGKQILLSFDWEKDSGPVYPDKG